LGVRTTDVKSAATFTIRSREDAQAAPLHSRIAHAQLLNSHVCLVYRLDKIFEY
jgi:hypothetical protein